MTPPIQRLVALIAILAAALGAFALGLFLMNIRSDLILAAGALICVAAPVFGGVALWRLIERDERT